MRPERKKSPACKSSLQDSWAAEGCARLDGRGQKPNKHTPKWRSLRCSQHPVKWTWIRSVSGFTCEGLSPGTCNKKMRDMLHCDD